MRSRCDECEKGFPTAQGLRQHKFTHGGLKPYKEENNDFFTFQFMLCTYCTYLHTYTDSSQTNLFINVYNVVFLESLQNCTYVYKDFISHLSVNIAIDGLFILGI